MHCHDQIFKFLYPNKSHSVEISSLKILSWSKQIKIIYTRSEDQPADIPTKILPDGKFHIWLKVLNGGWIVTSNCEGVLQYTKQLYFMSILVVLRLPKLSIIVFLNIHVLCTYFGMLNSEENVSKRRIDAINASIICNQYLITLSKKLLLTSVIDTFGVHLGLLHIL